ncbi:isoamylase early set domain-containing protein [Motilimonas pumila]|uniref:1,4-alpha-glucan branching protein n=1 Tax=Motilimonas pumila TaxID=2303987 RepID=A0A418YAX4_9GAMM|nr:isoamylase early set domain-containing protein [Motilimonas pumila]RJG40112.1 1,4-alpha-glucan branching protein [Motilimonas pumila]
MPVTKRFLKSKPIVKVTFEVEKEAAKDADKIFLVGEFNEWLPIELQKFKNGKFKTALDVATDGQTEFQYRFKLVQPDGSEVFDNDWQADAYVKNEFGTDNSVLRVYP